MQRNEEQLDIGHQIDALEYQLFEAMQLCTLIDGLAHTAAGASKDAQLDLVKAETLGVVFGMLSTMVKEARDGLLELNEQIAASAKMERGR